MPFLKELKPTIFSKLIFYTRVFNFENNRPIGTDKVQTKYLKEELKRFFDNNLEFYRYYRARYTFLDDKIFVRGKQDIHLLLDACFYEAGPTFSTSTISRFLRSWRMTCLRYNQRRVSKARTIQHADIFL